MPLAAGQTLSFYRILGPLGAGGMGEVYRAEDTRLEREVAIKVLPEELAGDEERLRRFEREAKTLASLNHANVAGIHGVDQEGDVCFLALELVPGEDLATRLARGPLPIDEALNVCRQIAEGLEAAHEAGVVHRDLKPANVRVTPEGTVKLLDFGLAKPIRPRTTGEGTSAAESDSFLMTEEGMVLGTPTYMSPEQARGRPVDRRTDLWAFGCVMYECLTGRRAFGGGSLTDVLAAIVGEEPDWEAVPPLPPRAAELLRRALTKDPRARLRDAGEARVQLQLAQAEPAGAFAAHGAPATTAPRRGWLAVTGGLCLAAGIGLGAFLRTDPLGEDASTARRAPGLRVVLETLASDPGRPDLALSPDGARVAWIHQGSIHVRQLGDLSSTTLLPAELDAGEWERVPRALAWSPDGRELAYSTGEGLHRVSLEGGPPILFCAQKDAAGAAGHLGWTDELGVVYLTDGAETLRSAPPTGVDPVTLLTKEQADVAHFDGFAPAPGGGLVIVRHRLEEEHPDTVALWRDGELADVLQLPGWEIQAVAAAPGHLVLQRDAGTEPSLWTVPFDPRAGEVRGEPVRFAEGGRDPAASRDGTTLYLQSVGAAQVQPVWIDLDGTVEPFGRRYEAEFMFASLSHDERQVFFSLPEGSNPYFAYDIERGVVTSALRTDATSSFVAGSLPDGRLLLSSFARLSTHAYWPGSREEPELIADAMTLSLGPQGERGLVTTGLGSGPRPLGLLDLGSGELTHLVDGDAGPFGPPRLSPDGRFVLYASNESGARELYLLDLADSGRIRQVTTEGGVAGWFDGDGETIYCMNGRPLSGAGVELWRVTLEREPRVRLGTPERLFELEGATVFATAFHTGEERLVGFRRLEAGELQLVLDTSLRR